MQTSLLEMKQVLEIVCRIFVIQIFVVSCTNGVNWEEKTTASLPDLDDEFDNMTPTPLAARRTNLDSNVIGAISPQRHLFRARTKKRQNKKTLQIWKWDLRCQKQPLIGRCNEEIPRYFYEVSRKECVNFTYSGCDGNMNNFPSLYECEKNCKGTLTPGTNMMDNSFCAMQPNAGTCFDILNRFYYDINQRKCLKFIYGGCGGNDNNFEYETECMKICQNVNLEESKENLREGDNDSSSDSK